MWLDAHGDEGLVTTEPSEPSESRKMLGCYSELEGNMQQWIRQKMCVAALSLSRNVPSFCDAHSYSRNSISSAKLTKLQQRATRMRACQD